MTENKNHIDEDLMKEIKAGNMLAFDILYKKYSSRIFKFAFSILKSADESENIVQDVFLNLWENRNKVEKNSSIKYYIFTITYNSSISVIRKKVQETKFLDYLKTLQQPDQEPENLELEYNELTSKLNDIINALPKRQKEVYLLHKIEGLKYQEIAVKLNISVNTIENHMSRALNTIRKKLGNYSILAILFWYIYL